MLSFHKILTTAILLAFVLTTLWAITVTGIFEQPRYDRFQFEAGSGNALFLVRLGLAIAGSAALLAGVFFTRSRPARALLALAAFLVFPAFWASVTCIERVAPGFSEPVFSALEASAREGATITSADVVESLGYPVLEFRTASGQLTWCYTYMPSGGFGWHKRVVSFDGRQNVSSIYALDEP